MSSLLVAVVRRHVRPLSPALAAGLETRRTYAKAKAKSHSKSPSSPLPQSSDLLVPKSQQILSDPASLQSYLQSEAKMRKSIDWYRKECASVEARASGRVTPSLLDPVRVELEGGEKVRLDSVATIGVRDGSVFWITAFDGSDLKLLERALYDSGLPSVVPQRVDDRTIKIPIPKPTVELRSALAKSASASAEEIRVQLRNITSAALKKGAWGKHSEEARALQRLTEKQISEVDNILLNVKKATGVAK